MRLLPAHQREAKDMARGLFDAFKKLGLVLQTQNPELAGLTLQQCQELMARSMGYAGWYELIRLVQRPHEPIYLQALATDASSRSSFEELVTRMACLTGTDVRSPRLRRAVEISGVGCSAAERRKLASMATPWGLIQEDDSIAPGIRMVTTDGHGGLALTPERNARMPDHLRNDDGFYEEDCEFNLVVLAFPSEASLIGQSEIGALRSLRIITDVPAEPSELEKRVVSYLGDCVRTNRIPIRFPEESVHSKLGTKVIARSTRSTLAAWADTLHKVPTHDGRWATRPGPWFDHWTWVLRDEQIEEAEDIAFDAMLKAQQSPSS